MNSVEKYKQLKEQLEEYKAEKIRTESKLESYKAEQKELEKQILEITNTTTINEAIDKKILIETRLEELFEEVELELSNYDKARAD